MIESYRRTSDELRAEWDRKYLGETVSVTKKQIGGFEVVFNPGRARYMATTLKESAVYDTDVFCHHREEIAKHEQIDEVKLPHFSWIVAINKSPIEQYHSLLICAHHEEQKITLECLEDLHTFSLYYPDLSVGFNSWGAGASQQHLHAQLFFSPLPISQWQRYVGLCQAFEDPQSAFLAVTQFDQKNIPCNLAVMNGITFVVPRKQEKDRHNIKRGFDSVSGKFPVLSEEDYHQYTETDILFTLQALIYQSFELESF